MNITRLQLTIIAGGALFIFAAGFFSGGIYASARATRSANAASLVYFTGIHDALDQRKYDRAAEITDGAVDGHVGVLRVLHASPWTASLLAVLPGGRSQEAWITSTGLSMVRKSYATQPDRLQPETRDFLAATH